MSLKLSDDAIIQVAKLLQIAILTGTDVIDNLRLLRFEKTLDGETLIPTKEYTKYFEEGLERMMETALKLSEQETTEDASPLKDE